MYYSLTNVRRHNLSIIMNSVAHGLNLDWKVLLMAAIDGRPHAVPSSQSQPIAAAQPAFAGDVLGLAAGYLGIPAILTLIPDNLPRIGQRGSNVNLDWRVLAFTVSLSILTGVLFGLVPALNRPVRI
jgi:hypothetical protein